jgi:hypothetical protein
MILGKKKTIGKTCEGPMNNFKMVPKLFLEFLKACLVRHINKNKLKLKEKA